jgi:uncharacterized membrane protein YedE/YeeE
MIAPFSETGILTPHGALLTAPLIGIAFGWFLERGGLGDAPRLAGQIYLTDLRVFKVMFSALITAMLGVFWLDRAGLLDLSLVHVPETFLLPQAIGGALFGIGFLIAGLCPGTSCVAAASGKLDGFGVIAGILGGVLLFNISFPWLEGFYQSTARGAITLPTVLGLSPGIVVALVTLAALGGFFLAGIIERPRV